MSHRTTGSVIPPPHPRTNVRGRDEFWRVSLVKVTSGVAAGRTRRGRGNATTEWWALFMSREQIDACSTADPLRFSDPLLFAQIKKELDHVFDRSDSCDFHSRA